MAFLIRHFPRFFPDLSMASWAPGFHRDLSPIVSFHGESVQPDTTAELDPAPVALKTPEPVLEAVVESVPILEAVSSLEHDTEPEAVVVEAAQPEAESEAQPEAQPEAESEAAVVEAAEPEAVVVEVAEPDTEPETVVVEATEPEAVVAEVAEFDAEPDAAVAEVAEPNAEPEVVVVEVAEPDAEPEAEVVEAAEPEAAGVEAAEPEAEPEVVVVEETPQAGPVALETTASGSAADSAASTTAVAANTRALPEMTAAQRDAIADLLRRYSRTQLLDQVSRRGWARKGNKEQLAQRLVLE